MIIEVAYALPKLQTLLALEVDDGTTLEQAIKISGICKKHPEIDLTQNKTGIFGKITPLNQVLRAKDRVEIYRPLIADPKKVRRKRANDEQVSKPLKMVK